MGVPVAVIVPVHGFAPYLPEALDSVLAQAPAEVIVVDDASPEPTALHRDHAACRIVRRTACGGPAAARQSGLEAIGDGVDLVGLCDADDAWEPGKLAAQVAALAADPGVAVVFGRAVVIGPDGRPTGEPWVEPPAGPLADPVAALYAHNPVPTSSVVVRRAALEAVGGFPAPTTLAEDWDLWLRLVASGAGFACVPEARVRYRRHAGGLTGDVAALARDQLALHEAHAGLVDSATARRARGADRRALRRERVRRAVRRLPGA